ncbi:MAG: T9SS type A sorting domain-containing protein [Bacteroidales bacterium]|nr:T9SS type A sorting domain-containing protein [Bacteroidales bacterium]
MKKAITYLLAIFAVMLIVSGTSMAQSYCASVATSTADSEIDHVGLIGNINSISNTTAGVCATYTDFTSLTPAEISPGGTYSIEVTAGTCGGNYTKGAIVFIDWNQDFDFADPGETIGYTTASSSTITYTIPLSVPFTATIGTTRMRVSVAETSSPSTISPCGGFYYGETEDYTVNVMPFSDIDAGVTAILSPGSLENEAASVPVDVIITNFGTDSLTAVTVSYSLNGTTPVDFSWTGLLASGTSDTVSLTNMTVPPGNNNICAWTTLIGDTIPIDDTTCMAFYGLPLWDAGVTAILAPGALELENTPVSPEVTIENFGVNTITAMDIVYMVNSGAPVTYAWTGSLAPNATANVILPSFIVPGGFDTICAYTVLPLDGDATNDETCFEFYADPQFDFAAFSFLSPESYCGMGLEDVTVQFINQGDTTYSFDLAYSANGGTPVVETVTQTVYPGDTLTYTFTTQIDMTTTLYDVLYSFAVWCDVTGDPLMNNDTIYADVMSMHIPEDPIAQGDTIVYGTMADLIAFSIDTINWYETDTAGAPIIYTGNFFTTPVLLDTTTYWVNASTGMEEDGDLTTLFAYNNGSNGNMFDVTAYTDITINSFDINNGYGSTGTVEVWYRPGSYVGFQSSSAGWTLLGSQSVTPLGANIPTPIAVGGLQIPAGQTYGLYVTFVSGTIGYTNGTGSNEVYENNDMKIQCGVGGSYWAVTISPRVWNGTIHYTAGVPGCASNLVPVTAIVTNIPTQDAGVVGLSSPVDGIELSQTETVTVDVYNYGLDPIWNIPVSFSVDGGPLTTEIIPDTIQPYGTLTYTFTGTANLSAIMVHTIEACTSHPSDTYTFNDCMSFLVESQPLVYCTSSATSTGYEEIVNVEIDLWANYSGPASGVMYSDFTNIPGPFLAAGATYPISITTDFPPGYSYQYNCWVKVFIDWNHDAVYDPATETVFSSATTSSNTVTGTFMVPFTAVPAVSGMRVVFVETSSATSVNPCGTYTWGETEDYNVMVAPQIPNDGGVTEIITPGALEVENVPIPVVVEVRNFGTDTLYAFDIGVEFNGAAAVVTPWTGSLAPTMSTTITLPMVNPIGASNTICAYTIVPNDSNTFNDGVCKTFWATPQYEAGITQIVHPESQDCGLGMEHITIRIMNYGDTISGSLLASYSVDGAAPVTEIVTTQILPGDSLDFAFAATYDFSVTTQNDTFDIVAYINLLGDPIPTNDSIEGSIMSMFTPDPPLVFNDTVPYGSVGTLVAQANAALYWYDDPAGSASGAQYLAANDTFITDILYDTTTMFVEASGAVFNDIQVGTGTTIYNTTSCNPYGQYYTSLQCQFLIKASELQALGFAGGEMHSLAMQVTNPAGAALQNFNISLGHTSINATSTTSWQTGLQQVFSTASYSTFVGWNTHLFDTPFNWDGVSNVIVQFCFSNGTSNWTTNASIYYHSPGFTCGMGQYTDGSFTCGTPPSVSTVTQRPNMKFNVLQLGCPSATIPVTAVVTGVPAIDAGVTDILSPNSGIELTNELVTVVIHNWGLNPIANFPVSYTINGGTPVTQIIPVIMQSGDVYTYTFPQPANLTAFATYEFCAYTGVVGDGWAANDTTCKTVVNDPLVYCTSSATSTGYEDVVDVGIGLWNNYSGPAVGSMYSDFTNIPGPFLAVGNSFDIYITTDFPPSYTYQYNCYVEVYIDYNHDGIFSDPAELAFGSATTSSNTVTGSFMVPYTAVPAFTGMRVVFVEGGSAASVQPCGTYTWGETEDYLVLIAPQIPNDAGVTEILQPINNMIENFVSPVEVTVQNYGTDTIWAMDVLYEVDGGTPVTYAYVGPLAPATSATIMLPDLIIPGGYYDLCAYTVLAGDSNTFNDQSCLSLFAIPQFEAGILSIDAPDGGGCDLGLEDVTVTVANYGDTIVVGNLELFYSHAGMTAPVVEIYPDTVFPFDTVTYTFTAQIDLGVTASTTFDIFAWIDLVGDPILTNDTTDASIWSGVTPDDPIVNNITIWSGEVANLTATNLDSTLIYNWYDVDTNSLFNGYTYTSPMLFDTTQLFVEALTGGGGSAIGITEINLGGNDYIEITNLSSSDFDATGYLVAVSNDYANINSVNPIYWNLGNFTGEEVQFKTDATGANYWGNNLFWNPGTPPTYTGWAVIIDDTGEIVDMVIWGWSASQIAGANIIINGIPVDLSTGWVGDGIMNYTSDFLNRIVYDTDESSDWQNTTVNDIGFFNPALIGTQAGGGCASALVPVTVNIQYAPYDAAVWAVTEPVSGAYLSLVDVTAHVYNNGLNAISNIPISYTWNGVLQASGTITSTLQPGDDIFYTFTQQLNLDTLWGLHTICVSTALANDGYLLNDQSCVTINNFDGDGETCATAWQYGWVNDPAVTGETTVPLDEEWWMVEAPGNVTNAYFSLCGTTWDTKLEVYSNCTGFYLWYNDDNYTACSSSASHIDVPLLSAGTYYVKVFGYSNYFGAYTLEIGGEMPCLNLDAVVTNVSCNGQANGSIDLTVTNVLGTLPFSYSWSTGDMTEDLFGIAAGTYCVTVTDAGNCQVTGCYTVTEPASLNLSVFGTNVSTLGGQDGATDLFVIGGVSPYTFSWSNGATTEDLANLYAGYYTVTVFDANGCASVMSVMIESPLPFNPPVPTPNIHEIAIPSNAIITLDASPLAYGSLLIVYYDSAGTMVPGGYTYWSGMASTLVAYGADGTNPGFAVGESFTWKVFDVASMDYYTGTVTYNTAYPNTSQFVVGGSSGIWGAEFLSIYTQNVTMPLGWSIFSTFISPLAPDIEDILAPIVSNIIIVKSGTGLVYWPLYLLDNINNIIIGQGYQVKTSVASVAEFVGYPVEPQLTPLSLPNGWSILGYLRQSPMAIIPIFSNQGMVNPAFTPPGILIIAKDDEGSIYWPQYGLDNIGTMDPGEGYQIKLAVPAPQSHFIFTYPMNSPNSTPSSKAGLLQPIKYGNKVNTGNNMTIGIPEGAWNIVPQTGDEVGVFNATGELVGATVYTGGHTAITVWGDDEMTEKGDGAVENTPLTLRYFDAATSTEQVIEVQKWESGNGLYSVNAIAVVGKMTISKTSSYALYQNMPNPFNATTEIKFSIPEDAQVNISVYDVLGNRIAEIVSRGFEAGEHIVQFDASELPSGNYFYKMIANDFVSTKPMHIVK